MQTVATILLSLGAVPAGGAGLLGATVLAERSLDRPDDQAEVAASLPATADLPAGSR